MTAGDFEYAWKRLLDPKTGSSAAFLGYVIEGGEAFNSGKGSKDDVKVTAVNDKTLKVTLTSPQKSFLSIVSNPAFFPVNKKIAEENPKWHEEADTFVGNGPFQLTEWKHDESLTMKKAVRIGIKIPSSLIKSHGRWSMTEIPIIKCLSQASLTQLMCRRR